MLFKRENLFLTGKAVWNCEASQWIGFYERWMCVEYMCTYSHYLMESDISDVLLIFLVTGIIGTKSSLFVMMTNGERDPQQLQRVPASQMVKSVCMGNTSRSG